MQVSDYQEQELRFAYCYHAYLHWRTHRRQPYSELASLNQPALQTILEPFGIHVLACTGQPIECRALVSLRPQDSMSACASKLKGQVSKWLRERLGLHQPTTLLARGYFACTSGDATTQKAEAYLEAQSEHHGYAERALPPVFVHTYDPDREIQPWWHADHACTLLRFHVVLGTMGRRGVFGPNEGAAVAACWLHLQRENRFALRKVSFVPDHVHAALYLHPLLMPAGLVVMLMNHAQRMLAERFPEELVRARVSRVWQPSAYIGSYGDLATPQVEKYMERWRTQE